MKKIFLASTLGLIVMVAGCNKDQGVVTPSTDQQVLGLVLQASAQSNSNSLILLKDGRTITPVSGFNPSNLSAGNKFKLSFTTAQSSAANNVINVNVTSYSAANDSTFVPAPKVTHDSSAVKDFLQGSFSGKFTVSKIDYTNPSDTAKVIQDVAATFHQNIYEVTLVAHNQSGGSGFFDFEPGRPQIINFVDTKIYPGGYNRDNLLNGQYTFVLIGDKTISLFKTTNSNKTFFGYLLTKN